MNIQNSDLTGQIFNNLQIIKELPNNKVLCKCLLCGNSKILNRYKVRTGHTKSCGCLKYRDKYNLKGVKVGLLTIIKKAENKKESPNEWICKCECGIYTTLTSSQLAHKRVLSCGCLVSKKSKERFEKGKGMAKYFKHNTNIKKIENSCNKKHSNNSTGYTGVYFCKNKKYKPYMASLKFRGKNIYLGYYDTPEEAYEARKQGEEKHFKPILDLEKHNQV